jgi:hypothetical protein
MTRAINSIISLALAAAFSTAAVHEPVKISVLPTNPLLFGKGARQALVVVAQYPDGTEEDVTQRARFAAQNAAVATVDEKGTIRAETNGASQIRVSYGGRDAVTTALVQRAEAPEPASFAAQILPILTKIGCNSGACHGAFHGQNGFKLSLFGYEPDADYDMIVRNHGGRRVNLIEPEQSLILLKPTFQIKHGGGQVIRPASDEYYALLNWIRAGARRASGERRITALRVMPPGTVLHGRNATRRLLVTARYSDGTEADVTAMVKFQSNDDSLVSVTREGLIKGLRGGETAIVVRGPGAVTAAKVGVVIEKHPLPNFAPNNFIDELIFAKWNLLQIPPSEPADDATYLRRVYLDVIGIIPTAEEVRRFLADSRAEKRAAVVDELLKRPEYADYWSVYWGDRLQNSQQLLYDKGPQNFTIWLRQAFRNNLPFDHFVQQLLTATGDMYDATRPASYYPLIKKPDDFATVTSQLFLGVSIECARCHNHPFERWTRDDFSGMAAFFAQVKHKPSGPLFSDYILFLDFEKPYQNPETKRVHLPKALNEPPLTPGAWTDRRELLANWITSPRNPYFAKSIVNRMWACFMGRGLVERVDDFRVTNPPTNEPLLNALSADFIEHGYDLQHLIKRITTSRTYQLSSVPNAGNKEDTMAYSRYYPRHLAAEQALDSISQATGVPAQFDSFYPGTRAMQVTHPEVESYFLDVFDRAPRKEVCERKHTLTLNQVIHRISGDTIQRRITNEGGLLSKMLAANRSVEEIIDELYLGTVSRSPTAQDRDLGQQAIARAGNVRAGLEDLFWSLLNSKEFWYNH